MRGLRKESKTRPIPLRLQLSGSGSGVLQQHIYHLSISLYMLNCITLHLSCPRITDIYSTAGIYLIHILIIIQSTHFDSSCPFMQNVLKKATSSTYPFVPVLRRQRQKDSRLDGDVAFLGITHLPRDCRMIYGKQPKCIKNTPDIL